MEELKPWQKVPEKLGLNFNKEEIKECTASELTLVNLI